LSPRRVHGGAEPRGLVVSRQRVQGC